MCDVHYRLCAKSARKPRLSAPVSPRPLSHRHKRLFYHRLLFSKKKTMKKRQESLDFFVDVEQRVAVGTPLAWIVDSPLWYEFLSLFFWSRCCCLQILQRLSPCRGLQWWVCGAIGLSAQNPGGLWFVWCGSGHKPLGSRLIGIHSSPHLILLLAARCKGKKMRYEL